MKPTENEIEMLPLYGHDIRIKTLGLALSHYIHLHKEGEVYFNPDYQRGYVWGEVEQQALLKSLFGGVPFLQTSVVYNKEGPVDKFCEVVDAQQRLTTIFKFVDGEIGYKLPSGNVLYYRDLTPLQRKTLNGLKVTESMLENWDESPVTLRQKAEYFYAINFSGVPQSNEHKEKVFDLIHSLL